MAQQPARQGWWPGVVTHRRPGRGVLAECVSYRLLPNKLSEIQPLTAATYRLPLSVGQESGSGCQLGLQGCGAPSKLPHVAVKGLGSLQAAGQGQWFLPRWPSRQAASKTAASSLRSVWGEAGQDRSQSLYNWSGRGHPVTSPFGPRQVSESSPCSREAHVTGHGRQDGVMEQLKDHHSRERRVLLGLRIPKRSRVGDPPTMFPT